MSKHRQLLEPTTKPPVTHQNRRAISRSLTEGWALDFYNWVLLPSTLEARGARVARSSHNRLSVSPRDSVVCVLPARACHSARDSD